MLFKNIRRMEQKSCDLSWTMWLYIYIRIYTKDRCKYMNHIQKYGIDFVASKNRLNNKTSLTSLAFVAIE